MVKYNQEVDVASSGFSNETQDQCIVFVFNIIYHLITGNQMGSFSPDFLEMCREILRKSSRYRDYRTYNNLSSEQFYNKIISGEYDCPALRDAFAAAQVEMPNATFEQQRTYALKNIDAVALKKDSDMFIFLTEDWNVWTTMAGKDSEEGRQILSCEKEPNKLISFAR